MSRHTTELRFEGRRLQLTPGLLALAAVAAVGAARLAAAFLLHGPLLMPDEYLYTAISRSVAVGGWPTVRGGPLDFVPVLAPVLTAPAWLVHDVGLAYRLAQLEGVVAMTLAALPAHALARRAGVGERGAAVAAMLAVLVPDLAFSGMLLSEPFAYPLFLAAVLAAVRALERPTARRQALFLAAAGLLCLARLQFAFLPFAYLAAAAVAARPRRLRAVLRSQALVGAGIVLAAALVALVGKDALAGRYSGAGRFALAPGAILHWSAANLVLLFVAAGWVTVPGALLGLARGLRDGSAAQRAFAALTVLATAALVLEAGIFGAGLGQLEERYDFYAAPLLVIAFLAALEQGLATRAHARLAGGLAAVTVLLPLDDPLFTGMRDQSPVLMAFALGQRHAHWGAPLVAGALLCALSLAALALGRRGGRAPLVGLASGLLLALGVGYAAVLTPSTRAESRAAWQLTGASATASLLAFRGNTVPADLMTTLFWNRGISRVLVVGGTTVDGFRSVPVRLGGGGRLLAAGGGLVSGPVVFQRRLETVSLQRGASSTEGSWGRIADAARSRIGVLVVGWSPETGTFAPNGRIAVAAPRPDATVRRTLRLRLRNPFAGTTRLRFACSSGPERTVAVGSQPLTVVLALAGRGVADCRFAIVSGRIHWRDGHAETVEAQLQLRGDHGGRADT